MAFIKIDKQVVSFPVEQIGIYVLLMSNAAYQATTYNGVKLEQGDLLISLREFANEKNISYQKLRTTLANLEEMSLIKIESLGKKGTLVHTSANAMTNAVNNAMVNAIDDEVISVESINCEDEKESVNAINNAINNAMTNAVIYNIDLNKDNNIYNISSSSRACVRTHVCEGEETIISYRDRLEKIKKEIDENNFWIQQISISRNLPLSITMDYFQKFMEKISLQPERYADDINWTSFLHALQKHFVGWMDKEIKSQTTVEVKSRRQVAQENARMYAQLEQQMQWNR